MRVTIDDPEVIQGLKAQAAKESDWRGGIKNVVERLLRAALATAAAPIETPKRGKQGGR